MKPTWTSRRPAAISASMIRRQASLVGASGFSQNTGLPASIAATTCSSWAAPQDATSTASTPASAMRSAAVACTTAPGRPAATCPARAASTSLTATTAPPVRTWEIRRMWSWPIMPVPMTPTLTVTAAPGRCRAGGARGRAPPFRHSCRSRSSGRCSLLPGHGRRNWVGIRAAGLVGDPEFFDICLQGVADVGGGAPFAFQLVGQLLQFGAAGHQAGQLVPGDLALLEVAEGFTPIEQQEPVPDGVGVVRVVGDEDDA